MFEYLWEVWMHKFVENISMLCVMEELFILKNIYLKKYYPKNIFKKKWFGINFHS